MNHDIDLTTLGRYFAGECSEEERRELECWIEADPARRARVAQLRAAWDRAAEQLPPVDVERAWETVARRKTARSTPAEPRRLLVHIGGAARPRRWLAAAAAAVLVVGSSTALWLARPPADRSAPVAAPTRTAATGPRQTADVYLADGTHVRLGASSTLRFPTTFGATRDVQLEGEAYFDVAHDEARPFAVHTPRAVARDLGTRFNVRAFRESPSTEVVVAEGAVALAAATGGDSVVLIEADLGRLDAAGRLSRTRNVDVAAHLAWMEGRLVFADTPLREALPQLSAWFGVDFAVAEAAFANARLTATLELASLPQALRHLSAVLDARVERRGDAVVLHPNRRAR